MFVKRTSGWLLHYHRRPLISLHGWSHVQPSSVYLCVHCNKQTHADRPQINTDTRLCKSRFRADSECEQRVREEVRGHRGWMDGWMDGSTCAGLVRRVLQMCNHNTLAVCHRQTDVKPLRHHSWSRTDGKKFQDHLTKTKSVTSRHTLYLWSCRLNICK